MSKNNTLSFPEERQVSFGPDLPLIPERLLLSHAQGGVLFIAGAGVSRSADLEDVKGLVRDVYFRLDAVVYAEINKLLDKPDKLYLSSITSLSERQIAELKRYAAGDYDVVLGMLERRIDGEARETNKLREAVEAEIRTKGKKSQAIHRALMRLADRGAATTIATTNFDLLLEDAARAIGVPVQTYSLGAIPRPGRADDFAGVLHIHGALDRNASRNSEFIVSDHDFGEYYLRRRIVPDFIYDAARLFNIVLVGYSANDPPMRYLLNAVAADGTRFDDMKERFAFIGSDKQDPVDMEDWRGRGITPIWYDSANKHAALLQALKRWSELSAINGSKRTLDAAVKRIVKQKSFNVGQQERDLFEHIIRRSDRNELTRLSRLASLNNADIGWIDKIANALNAGGEAHG